MVPIVALGGWARSGASVCPLKGYFPGRAQGTLPWGVPQHREWKHRGPKNFSPFSFICFAIRLIDKRWRVDRATPCAMPKPFRA